MSFHYRYAFILETARLSSPLAPTRCDDVQSPHRSALVVVIVIVFPLARAPRRYRVAFGCQGYVLPTAAGILLAAARLYQRLVGGHVILRSLGVATVVVSLLCCCHSSPPLLLPLLLSNYTFVHPSQHALHATSPLLTAIVLIIRIAVSLYFHSPPPLLLSATRRRRWRKEAAVLYPGLLPHLQLIYLCSEVAAGFLSYVIAALAFLRLLVPLGSLVEGFNDFALCQRLSLICAKLPPLL
mmetsp:Transcript_2076/g.3255  ORF Transcript_2076/g.3255 Transcript_2076/m.3255 type:complete len:240 (-) Transcript_2076:474-1193(-)